MEERKKLRVIAVGGSGEGKTHFAATWPKPMLVIFTDPIDKAEPLFRRVLDNGGSVNELESFPYGLTQSCHNKKGDAIIRIEYFVDEDPLCATAMQRLLARMQTLRKDLIDGGYQTLVWDSATSTEGAGRMHSMFTLNPGNRAVEAEQGIIPKDYVHSNASSAAVKRILQFQLPYLRFVNVVVLGHEKEYWKTERDDKGKDIRVLDRIDLGLPGQTTDTLLTVYGEYYRIEQKRVGGEWKRYLQTEKRSSLYSCRTLVGIPDGAPADYAEMWPK